MLFSCSDLQSDLGAVAWGTLGAPSRCDCGWRACAAGPLESRPPTLHIKGLPPGSSCKAEGIGRGGTWEQAGRRENLQPMFLVAAPAGGAVVEGSVAESRVLRGFRLDSGSSQEQKGVDAYPWEASQTRPAG